MPGRLPARAPMTHEHLSGTHRAAVRTESTMDHNADRPCPDTPEAAPRAAAHGTAARRGVRALLPVAAAALLAAGACGAPEEDGEAAGNGGAQHNDADVMFAQMMIPHHEQALEMAELAEDRSGPEVGDLAAEIAEAQGILTIDGGRIRRHGTVAELTRDGHDLEDTFLAATGSDG